MFIWFKVIMEVDTRVHPSRLRKKEVNMSECEYLPIITRKCSTRAKVDDLIMIERTGRKISVTADGNKWTYNGNIQDAWMYLDKRFYNCLRGCIINFEKVEIMKDNQIIFVNGLRITIGRDNFNRTRQAYNAYLRRKSRLDRSADK